MIKQTFTIDEIEYDTDMLSENGKTIFVLLEKADVFIREKKNLVAVLKKAKKAYISELKSEVISAKAGLDFS